MKYKNHVYDSDDASEEESPVEDFTKHQSHGWSVNYIIYIQ